MKYLVNEIRNIELILGKYSKKIQENEKKNIINTRRSYAANKDIEKNKEINSRDLIMLRPRISFYGKNKKIFFKKKTTNKISSGSIIMKNSIKL